MSQGPLGAASALGLQPGPGSPAPLGLGLIHRTWRVPTDQGAMLIQALNSSVFDDPVAVAMNAHAAALRVDSALTSLGDADPRHRLVYRVGPAGRPWVRLADGTVWRAMTFIAGSRPVNPTRPDEVRGAARLLGRFPGLLAAGTGPRPEAILPGFHDTPSRLQALEAARDTAAASRRRTAARELSRLLELGPLARRLGDQELPERLVHNDAKLDNVLVDAPSGRALCVVDLDTVMPGLAAHDFGDLVRTAVTGRPEDEPDPAAVTVRQAGFEDLTAGYLEGAAGWLTAPERASLLDGALVITYEQAVRFLTDYLAGNPYYSVDDAEHNLRRTRAQLALLDALLRSEIELRRIVG